MEDNMKANNEENQKNEEIVAVAKKKPAKKKNKKIIIIIVIVAVVLLLVVAVGCIISNVSKNMQAAMEEMSAGNESTFEVEKQDVEQEITTSGTVIGIEKNAYVSPVTAKVEDIRVEVGQMVSKGDILLTYDASELGDNLSKVKIQAQSEQAVGNESFEAADEAAEKASAASKKVTKLKKEIASAKKEAEAISDQITAYEDQLAETEEKNAKEEAKAATPTEDGTTREPKLIDTKSIKQTIRSLNKDLTKKNEEIADKQSKLAEQEAIVSANKDVKVSDSTKAQVDAAKQLSNMNINDAQESLDAAQAGITAAEDGIVESIEVVKGAYANETQTLMTIISADQIGVEFSISKDDLGSITNGQKARVVIGGNEYEGAVEFVSKVATVDAVLTGNNSTGGTIKGRILIDNPDDEIYIGVSAKVYIFVGKSEQALVVPYEALNTDIDGDYVYIVNDKNLIERKDVTIGIYSGEYYEVLEGLQEGDKVIKEVTKDMKPGDEYVDEAMAGMAAE